MFPGIPSRPEELGRQRFFGGNPEISARARMLLRLRPGGVMGGNWLQECIAEMNGLVRQPIRPEHQGIADRARGYSFGVAGFLQNIEAPPERDHVDPRSVILHYCAFIPPKVYRALAALANGDVYAKHWPRDHDGSAKGALITIERSRAAWIALAERGLVPIADAEQFASDLSRLADDLDRVFPNARAFVRPRLDEPDEVAKLS